MDEQTKPTEAYTENNPDGRDKPKPLDKIERAELAVKRMEEAEKRIDEKIAQLTELQANKILGPTAGGHVEVPVKEETPQEYKDRVMRGEIK